jgi:VanZ family protein
MTTIAGLPAHALLVHAIVVLVPLTALLEILCALWPAARQRLVWLVLAFGVVVMVLTPLTAAAGSWLYDQNQVHQPITDIHAERGEWMKYFAIGLLVVAIAQAVQHWRESRSEEPKRVVAVAIAVLAVVVGVSSIVAVWWVGDSGAHSVWGGR